MNVLHIGLHDLHDCVKRGGGRGVSKAVVTIILCKKASVLVGNAFHLGTLANQHLQPLADFLQHSLYNIPAVVQQRIVNFLLFFKQPNQPKNQNKLK